MSKKLLQRKKANNGHKDASKADVRPIWEIAEEIGASIPDREWEKVPTDLSTNFDHYLYGAPKAGK